MKQCVSLGTVCLVLMATCLVAALRGNGPDVPEDQFDHPAIEAFLLQAGSAPASYRAIRTLEASTRGGRMRATLKAATSFSPEEGFQYSVVEESGSTLIRNRVLRAALEAERTITQRGEGRRGALDHDNYQFTFDGEDEAGHVRVRIKPRRIEKLLIDGSLLLNAVDGDLLEVAGTLVKRPSFWTRHVEVVRRYARLAGARLPVTMQSTADVPLAGESTFVMSYDYQMVNGVEMEAESAVTTEAVSAPR